MHCFAVNFYVNFHKTDGLFSSIWLTLVDATFGHRLYNWYWVLSCLVINSVDKQVTSRDGSIGRLYVILRNRTSRHQWLPVSWTSARRQITQIVYEQEQIQPVSRPNVSIWISWTCIEKRSVKIKRIQWELSKFSVGRCILLWLVLCLQKHASHVLYVYC
jgi:hypothetical protein